MTKRQGKSGTIDIKAVLAEDEEFLRALVRMALQEVLEADMTEALGAEKGERAVGRQGYRSGYYGNFDNQISHAPISEKRLITSEAFARQLGGLAYDHQPDNAWARNGRLSSMR